MRRLVLLLGTLAACGGDDAPTGPMTVAVTHYEYTFDLESRAAHATLTIDVTGEGDCLTLPMRPDVEGDVTLDGVVAKSTSTAGDDLAVCGAGWRVGDTVVLDVDTEVPLETWGASQVGYSINFDVGDFPFYYLVSWVGGCDRFAPCDSAPSKFARYTFHVTHPDGVTVLCPGEITPGATETTCAFDRDGGPTYSTFGVVASPNWEVVDHGDWNGVAVTVYNRTGSAVERGLDDAYNAGFLAFMEDHFGPYPFGDELRVISGPTYWAGFEHPGNIVLDDQLGGVLGTPVTHTMLHELAHQWAGDQTTLAGTYDFVWKEAMAEYLTFVYEDETVPADGDRTAQRWRSNAVGAAYYPVPEEEPPLLDYYGEVYGPGPMVLFRQLEALFSRDQVLDAIASVLGQPRALSLEELRFALEDTTGADLAGYFDRWVRGAGAPTWPEFTVTTNDTGEDVEVTVTQLRPEDGLYGCAFDVQLQGATADQRAEVHFDLGVDGLAQDTQVAIAPGFDPVAAVLDPHATCLAFRPAATVALPHAPGWSPWVVPHAR